MLVVLSAVFFLLQFAYSPILYYLALSPVALRNNPGEFTH